MNQDAVINQLAHFTGTSRKQVIEALKQMSKMPDVRKAIRQNQHGKKGRLHA